jgi:hypothetical protein
VSTAERWLIEILIVAALASGLVLYLEHRGAERIEAADQKALDAAAKQAEAETALNAEKANKADEVADASQKAIDSYIAAHPIEPVRVCHASNSVPGVPKASAAHSGPQSPSAGPATVPGVPDSTAGPDIGPGLAIIVQAAERLAIIDADRQKRE